jgi:hypothetical protein
MHVHTHISQVTTFDNIEIHIHVHTNISVETNMILDQVELQWKHNLSAQHNLWLQNNSLIYILSTRELETKVKYLVY